MTTPQSNQAAPVLSPAKEKMILLVLAAIQFTLIVDFMIMMPLGPQYTRAFHIDIGQFNNVVGIYGVAAGLTGIISCFFLDQFDRKRALVFLYFGFCIGTFFCAIAPSYHLMLGARFFAGAFGGVCGPVILSIVGDLIPFERRGRAMGMVMTAFSIAQIVGLPMGLLIADRLKWQAPFYLIALLGLVVLATAWTLLPPLREHLKHEHDEHPIARTWSIIMNAEHQKAYIFMFAITAAGFTVLPIAATFFVNNLGISQLQLVLCYIIGGICTVFSMNIVGKWSDMYGKATVFTLVSLISIIPVLIITNLSRASVPLAITLYALLMIFMSGRMVPAMALMTGVVEARYRGGFMSINSSVQQFTLGISTYVTGLFLGQTADGQITHYNIAGYMAVGFCFAGIYLSRFLKPHKQEGHVVAEPVMMEM